MSPSIRPSTRAAPKASARRVNSGLHSGSKFSPGKLYFLAILRKTAYPEQLSTLSRQAESDSVKRDYSVPPRKAKPLKRKMLLLPSKSPARILPDIAPRSPLDKLGTPCPRYAGGFSEASPLRRKAAQKYFPFSLQQFEKHKNFPC